MIRYIIRRLLAAIPVLLAVYTIVFLLIHATPGGPWSSEKTLPPAVIKNLNAKFSLDQPLWKQYLIYLRNLAQGDLGPSYRQRNRTVRDIIVDFFPVSLQLGLVAMIIGLMMGISLGVISALSGTPGLTTVRCSWRRSAFRCRNTSLRRSWCWS
jgi:oligopeptide transport system permease protein